MTISGSLGSHQTFSGQESRWRPTLLLFAFLVLFSTTRNFAYVRVGTHPTHTQAPSIPDALTTPANSCSMAILRPAGVCTKSMACVQEDSSQAGPRTGLRPSGQGNPVSLVGRTWSKRGDLWARWTRPHDLLDSCPTERTTARREPEKDPVMHGSQGKGSVNWIWGDLPLPFHFNLNNLTPCILQKQNDVEEIKWVQVLSKKAKWMIYHEVTRCECLALRFITGKSAEFLCTKTLCGIFV